MTTLPSDPSRTRGGSAFGKKSHCPFRRKGAADLTLPMARTPLGYSMTITSARELFAQRYYEGAKGWLRQEAQSDFRILRTLKETQAAAYLKFLGRFDRETQRWHSECLQDRFHLTALQLLGRNATPKCEELVREYRQFALGFLQCGDRLEPKVRRAELRRLLKTELGKLSQREVESPGGGELRVVVRVGDTLVTSSVCTGSQMYDLTYSHSVEFSKGDVIVDHLSVLSWCGISSQTMWMDIPESRGATVASGVGKLVEAFLDASRDLVGDFRLGRGQLNVLNCGQFFR